MHGLACPAADYRPAPRLLSGPQPFTPTPAAYNRLSSQTEPSPLTTPTVCLSPSHRQPRGWKRQTATALSLGLKTNPQNTKSLPQYTQMTSNLQSHNHTQAQSCHPMEAKAHTHSQRPATLSHKAVPRHPTETTWIPSGSQVLQSQRDTCQSHMVSHSSQHGRSVMQPIRIHLQISHAYTAPVGLPSPTRPRTATQAGHMHPMSHLPPTPCPSPEPCAPIHA